MFLTFRYFVIDTYLGLYRKYLLRINAYHKICHLYFLYYSCIVWAGIVLVICFWWQRFQKFVFLVWSATVVNLSLWSTVYRFSYLEI